MATHAQICPRFHRAVELLGRRWTTPIIRVLIEGPARFTDMMAAIPGLNDPVLSQRLKELEREGIVRRRVFNETPVRIEYALTPKGHDLERAAAEVQRWAERWITIPQRHRQSSRTTARS